MNHDLSLKATPSTWARSNGVASSDEDSIALPWVMQTTSLLLSGWHYPRLLKWPPFGRFCQSHLGIFAYTLLIQLIPPTGYIFNNFVWFLAQSAILIVTNEWWYTLIVSGLQIKIPFYLALRSTCTICAFGEDRLRFGIENKNLVFIWHSAQLALSLWFVKQPIS